jgi:hypothetical protein
MLDRDDLLRWLKAHDAALRTADRARIAGLFSADAVHHLGPWDAPWRGLEGPFREREAIAAGWLAGDIKGGPFSADANPLAIDAATAVVRGRITYFDEDGGSSAGTTRAGSSLRRRRPAPSTWSGSSRDRPTPAKIAP